MTNDLLIQLTYKISVILVIAFLLSKINVFKNIVVKRKFSVKDKVSLTIIFSVFGILGTYYGLPVKNALANMSTIGVVTGGLLGGPIVGFGTSCYVALYRIHRGGYVALVSGFSTVIVGIVSGMLHNDFLKRKSKGFYGLLVGFIAQLLLLSMILLFAKPYTEAKELVEIIAFPMIVVNSAGVAIFISILNNIFNEQDRIGAMTAQISLDIANQTLTYLRHGLEPEYAKKTVEIIYGMVDHISAVAITKKDTIIAHAGLGVDHHRPMDKIMNNSTEKVLETGVYSISQQKKEIGCKYRECELNAAITVPLKIKEEVIGTLLLYKEVENSITSVDIQLALGLAQLFSTQLEISEAEKKERLLEKAELKALQAQINPHFLFNAINTIVSFTRTDCDMARKLLIHLGNCFRNSLQKIEENIDFNDEIKNIQSYLAIEEARFGHKLKVEYVIDKNICCKVPPLIIQPIVENAVKHGLLPKKYGGTIKIEAYDEENDTVVSIIDNGIGMEKGKMIDLLNGSTTNQGIGIVNVDKRLKAIFGEEYGLKISSEMGKGTKVIIRIPKKYNGREK